MKRFSKMVSTMVPTPSAIVLSAANCACMSVGNAGYGAVRTSTDFGRLPFMSTSIQLGPMPTFAPASRSFAVTASRCSGSVFLMRTMPRGDRAGDQVGAALDAIRLHLVARGAQLLHALDDDLVGARALDLRAHGDQEFREVHHFRFARRVFDDGFAVRERRRHHEILGAGDRHGFEIQPRALQPPGARADVAAVDAGCPRPSPAGPRRGCSPAARRWRSRRAATRRPCRSAPAADPAPGWTRAWSSPARTARNTRAWWSASISMRIFSSMVTETPMRPNNSIMVVTSCRCGTLRMVTGPSASSAPATIGSVAFFAPEMRTSPSRGMPPLICSLSTDELVRWEGR